MRSEELREFYTRGYAESERLSTSAHGRLEFIRTCELLDRVLPPAPARVLDIGGGPGVYARWLATRGYEVQLVDVVDTHVLAARSIPGVHAEVGDARELSGWADGSADAVLLLGPLYHLPDARDRAAALREARRILRPGGPIAAAAISRHSALLDFIASGNLSVEVEESTRQVMRTGTADDLGFVRIAYLHSPVELADELTAAGFTDVEVYGVEGPGWPMADLAAELPEPALDRVLDSALRAARMVERDPAVIAASAHFLALGTR